MPTITNKKIRKLSLFILPIILLSGLNFCLFFIKPAVAETSDSQLSENINSYSVIGSCADHSINENSNLPAFQAKSSDSNNENSLPSCCLNHDNTAKIVSPVFPGLNNLIQPAAASEIHCISFQPESIFLRIDSSGSSPPQDSLLSCVLKKE